MKIQYLSKIASMICFLSVLLVLAHAGAAVGQPGLPGPPEQTPIDGGLSILAILGGSYAIHKLRKTAKREQ